MSAVCVGWILPGMHLAHFLLVHARRGASSDGLVLFHVCQTQPPTGPPSMTLCIADLWWRVLFQV